VRRALLGAARDPVVWIFLLAGTFEILTGDPTLHATLLYAVAAVLVADPIVRRVRGGGPVPAVEPARGTGGRRRRALVVAGVVAGVVFAVVIGSLRRYTLPVTLSVWAVGAPALVWGWRGRPRHRADQPLPGAGLAAWAGVLAGIAAWELVALSFQPSLSINAPDHPTLSTLTNPALAHPAVRMLALGAWLAVGWFLVER
jgi:hypothetical protein